MDDKEIALQLTLKAMELGCLKLPNPNDRTSFVASKETDFPAAICAAYKQILANLAEK